MPFLEGFNDFNLDEAKDGLAHEHFHPFPVLDLDAFLQADANLVLVVTVGVAADLPTEFLKCIFDFVIVFLEDLY